MELSWIVTEEQKANANTAESASVMAISMTHTVMLRVFLLYQILFFSGRTGCLTLLIKTPYNEIVAEHLTSTSGSCKTLRVMELPEPVNMQKGPPH